MEWSHIMSDRMILHDTRLAGNPPPIAQNIYNVDGGIPIQHCVGWIGCYASVIGGLDELMIMCHGYEADWDLSNLQCTGVEVGGFGLQLCAEGLTNANTGLVATWKGSIKKVTIFACAAAGTGTGNAGTSADGMRFMSQLAISSGAEIIASDTTQIYDISWWNKVIDFGQWEGTVYSFDPTSGQPTPISPGPMQ
jgi:hypothetical protein